MQNLRFVSSAIPEILGGSQNLKSRSRELGHAHFSPIFHFFGLVSLTVNPFAKFKVCTFNHSRDIRGSQNSKVGHVTQLTLPCDLILYFWISNSWSPVELQISTWLDFLFSRYRHCKILAFWLENAYSGLF